MFGVGERQIATAVALARRSADTWARDPRSLEIQRSGFLGHAELIGDLFVPLLVVEALHGAGIDGGETLDALVAERPQGDLRYYRDCSDLPWDCDDAAAVLIVHALTGGLRDWPGLEQARKVLAAARDAEGGFRTWIADPDRPDLPVVGPWLGPICSAVAARGLRAMAVDPGFGAVEVTGSATWLAARVQPDGGFLGAHYPSRVLATATVLESLVVAAGGREVAWAGTAEGAADWLAAQQGTDGAIGGSAHETAAALLALDRAGRLDPALARGAVAFLVGTQRWDGTWPETDVYLCPHPAGAIRPFRSVTLASAVVLEALTRACPSDRP